MSKHLNTCGNFVLKSSFELSGLCEPKKEHLNYYILICIFSYLENSKEFKLAWFCFYSLRYCYKQKDT